MPIGCERHGNKEMHLPPSMKEILETWPDVIPDPTLNRDLVRCRACDLELVAGHASSTYAEDLVIDIEEWYRAEKDKFRKYREAEKKGEAYNSSSSSSSSSNKIYNQWKLVNAHYERIREWGFEQRNAQSYLSWMPFWAVWGKPSIRDAYYPDWPYARIHRN